MRHGYMYNGGFEKNYSSLKAGMTTYKSSEGEVRPLPEWPAKVDGIRVSYMEKSGKKFYAVRVQFDGHDIVLKNPVLLDTIRKLLTTPEASRLARVLRAWHTNDSLSIQG